MSTPRETLRRNVKVRLAALNHTISSLSRELGVSKQVLSHKLDRDSLESSVDWLAVALFVPNESLTATSPSIVGSQPLPPEGWTDVVRSALADENLPTYNDLTNRVWTHHAQTPTSIAGEEGQKNEKAPLHNQ